MTKFNRKSFVLREARIGDLELVFKWRNQLHIRNVSLNNQELNFNEHKNWFLESINNNEAAIYIFEKDFLPLGLIKFQYSNAEHFEANWSFYIGEVGSTPGCGTAMAFFALERFFNRNSFCNKIIAEVLSENLKSVVFHSKLGFQLIRKESIFNSHRNTTINVETFELRKIDWENARERIESLLFI